MNPLDWLRKQIAIEHYLGSLPLHLLKDYGHVAPYTPAQVTSTIKRQRISHPKFIPYALALFCDLEQLDEPTPTARLAGAGSYKTLRNEMIARRRQRAGPGEGGAVFTGDTSGSADFSGSDGGFGFWGGFAGSDACSSDSGGGDCGGGDGGGGGGGD